MGQSPGTIPGKCPFREMLGLGGLEHRRPRRQSEERRPMQTLRPPAAGQDLTFADLAALEPALWDLLAEARSLRPTDEGEALALFCGYSGYGPGLKRRLSALVGWYSGRGGVLGSSGAYDVAYAAVLD